MRGLLKTVALAAIGALAVIGGVTVGPDTAEAGRVGRSFIKSVAAGSAVRSATRPSYARGSEEEAAETRKVDFEARAREARAKLAAESAGGAPLVVPASSATALPVDERKAVCVAGCY